jgi:hypothetical protein
MLKCYLDDSGTHDRSKVVVWGGVVGHSDYLAQFEHGWKERLREPCEGRPPVKAFHSFDLSCGVGEFEGYSRAESDLTRFNFRKVIVDAGLTWLSVGVSVSDWNSYASVYLRQGIAGAERLAFGKAIMLIGDSAHEHNEPVSFHFDKGREPYVASMFHVAVDESHIDNALVSHDFSCVSQNVALQAADLVAHETYRFCTEYFDNVNAKPNAHLQRLQEGGHDCRIAWFGRDEIRDLSRALEASLKAIEANHNA